LAADLNRRLQSAVAAQPPASLLGENPTRHGADRAGNPAEFLAAIAMHGAGRIVLGAFLLSATHPASANPWLKEKGEGEFISNATISRQESGLASGAQTSASSDLHLEFGALPSATVVADTSVHQYEAAGQSLSTFDTASLGVRANVRRWDNSVLSSEVHLGISEVRDSFLPGSPVALDGTGEARLMFGEGFDVLRRHAFAGVEAGWRWRAGPPADEALLDAILGIDPWQSALLMLQSFAVASTGPASGAYRRYGLVKLQLTLAQRVSPRWWIQAGLIETVAGKDAGEAGAVLPLWMRF